MSTNKRLAALGAAVPDLLLPAAGADLSQWAVIACDQHTQDRAYWESVRAYARDAPSSLNLIYPEVYLDDSDHKDRITSIHRTMSEYLETGIFAPPQKALVYVERDTPYQQKRRGLVIALDLEHYDWKPGSAPMIRPTEGTVPERLPPRMEIRRNAPLETPHILVLIADEENTLLPALGEKAKNDPGNILYDTELMFGSGRVKGWKLDTEADWEILADGLEKLASKTPFLYAVGDGNHSLATAKAVWEEYKAARQNSPDIMNHPARWALVELENLYDPALVFEPIHRLLYGSGIAELQQLLAKLPGYRGGTFAPSGLGGSYRCRKTDPAELAALVEDENSGCLRFGLVFGDNCLLAEADPVPLAVEVLGPLLDSFVEEQNQKGKKVTIDYIHGKDELFRLASAEDAAGILLPPFCKQGLFETVAKQGPLPRKSFSMGEACEKRFYLECRRLLG